MDTDKLLYSKYDTLNEGGIMISDEFRNLVDTFIRNYCDEYDTIQLEHVLNDVIGQSMSFNRIKKSIAKRRLSNKE